LIILSLLAVVVVAVQLEVEVLVVYYKALVFQ
jgi:hypothetical protein